MSLSCYFASDHNHSILIVLRDWLGGFYVESDVAFLDEVAELTRNILPTSPNLGKIVDDIKSRTVILRYKVLAVAVIQEWDRK